MEKASANQKTASRVAFVAPQELVEDFRLVAKSRDSTVSRELRLFMARTIAERKAVEREHASP